MKNLSISFTLGKGLAAHGSNIQHNNRKFTAKNVDETRFTSSHTSSSTLRTRTCNYSARLCESTMKNRRKTAGRLTITTHTLFAVGERNRSMK